MLSDGGWWFMYGVHSLQGVELSHQHCVSSTVRHKDRQRSGQGDRQAGEKESARQVDGEILTYVKNITTVSPPWADLSSFPSHTIKIRGETYLCRCSGGCSQSLQFGPIKSEHALRHLRSEVWLCSLAVRLPSSPAALNHLNPDARWRDHTRTVWACANRH